MEARLHREPERVEEAVGGLYWCRVDDPGVRGRGSVASCLRACGSSGSMGRRPHQRGGFLRMIAARAWWWMAAAEMREWAMRRSDHVSTERVRGPQR